MVKGICKGNCSSKEKIITNKHFFLCDNCNRKRLKKNKWKSKEDIIKEEVARVYKIIDANFDKCSGCGRKGALSHSHLIPKSLRKDLEANINNITLHCLVRTDGSEGCHSRWESNNPRKMFTLMDLEDNFLKIKELDLQYYQKLIHKLKFVE